MTTVYARRRYLNLHRMTCVKKEIKDNHITQIFLKMYTSEVVEFKQINQILLIYLFEYSTENSKVRYIDPKHKYSLQQPFATAALNAATCFVVCPTLPIVRSHFHLP